MYSFFLSASLFLFSPMTKACLTLYFRISMFFFSLPLSLSANGEFLNPLVFFLTRQPQAAPPVLFQSLSPKPPCNVFFLASARSSSSLCHKTQLQSSIIFRSCPPPHPVDPSSFFYFSSRTCAHFPFFFFLHFSPLLNLMFFFMRFQQSTSCPLFPLPLFLSFVIVL